MDAAVGCIAVVFSDEYVGCGVEVSEGVNALDNSSESAPVLGVGEGVGVVSGVCRCSACGLGKRQIVYWSEFGFLVA